MRPKKNMARQFLGSVLFYSDLHIIVQQQQPDPKRSRSQSFQSHFIWNNGYPTKKLDLWILNFLDLENLENLEPFVSLGFVVSRVSQ